MSSPFIILLIIVIILLAIVIVQHKKSAAIGAKPQMAANAQQLEQLMSENRAKQKSRSFQIATGLAITSVVFFSPTILATIFQVLGLDYKGFEMVCGILLVFFAIPSAFVCFVIAIIYFILSSTKNKNTHNPKK